MVTGGGQECKLECKEVGKKPEVIKSWQEERIDEIISGLMPLTYISSPF